MAYARWGTESDVYVIKDILGGWTCVACQMISGDFNVRTPMEMVDHLEEHRVQEDTVPPSAIQRLLNDARGG